MKQKKEAHFLSLSNVSIGSSCLIKEIKIEENDDRDGIQELCDLGFIRGTRVKVLAKDLFKSTLLLRLFQSEIYLRREMTDKIYVKTLS